MSCILQLCCCSSKQKTSQGQEQSNSKKNKTKSIPLSRIGTDLSSKRKNFSITRTTRTLGKDEDPADHRTITAATKILSPFSRSSSFDESAPPLVQISELIISNPSKQYSLESSILHSDDNATGSENSIHEGLPTTNNKETSPETIVTSEKISASSTNPSNPSPILDEPLQEDERWEYVQVNYDFSDDLTPSNNNNGK